MNHQMLRDYLKFHQLSSDFHYIRKIGIDLRGVPIGDAVTQEIDTQAGIPQSIYCHYKHELQSPIQWVKPTLFIYSHQFIKYFSKRPWWMESQLVTAKHFRAEEINLPGGGTKWNPINNHTPLTDRDHPPGPDGWTPSIIAGLLGTPRGLPNRSGEWITPFCSCCKHLLRDRSPKLWLNLLPSRPHKKTLLPPRSPGLHATGVT